MRPTRSSPAPPRVRARSNWSQNGTLKTYAGFPHGMPTTHADTINADLLAFIQS